MAEVILALDLPGHGARRLLDQLPELRWVKVGAILFTQEGPALVRELTGRGLNVFLDLKWHDIPNTVAGAVAAARDLGIHMATVHTLGGSAMMEAAARAAGSDLALLGVTVLTSHTADSLGRAIGRNGVVVAEEVTRLTQHAVAAGLAGVVCAPQEVAMARRTVGNRFVVVPGIRRPGEAAGDQARTASPRDAARSGASHLVVGRPILEAPDPAEALRETLADAR
ncbi:MAG TPA: orotidine-5'-phosphate decarboxylase [Gemmatimonadales bacterium]|nr:orotidine-5'-phosphate decarboxylase [Gemmatimonadales bacterium]